MSRYNGILYHHIDEINYRFKGVHQAISTIDREKDQELTQWESQQMRSEIVNYKRLRKRLTHIVCVSK